MAGVSGWTLPESRLTLVAALARGLVQDLRAAELPPVRVGTLVSLLALERALAEVDRLEVAAIAAAAEERA